MLSTDTACLALSTASTTEEGERLGRALVEEQLAACVTVVPEARSIYRWEGAIESAGEALLLIKTTRERLEALEQRLLALHSYQTPEFLVFPIEAGSAAYLAWLTRSLRREAQSAPE